MSKFEIQCPICGKYYKMITKQHLNRIHGLSLDDFRKLYPNQSLVSDEYRKSCSDTAKEAGKDVNLRKLRSLNAKKQHEDGRHNPSEVFKKLWETKRDFMIQRMKEGNSRPEEFERKSKASREYWSDIDKVNKRNDKVFEYKSPDGSILKVRSSYEVLACGYLDKLNVPYLYEYESFPYEYNGKIHNYIIDYYLPTYDVYLEVKPKDFENNDLVLAKFNAVLGTGNKIVFVDEDWLKCLDNFKNCFQKNIG